jgi:putative ABC transport system substrate-binding protein
MNSILRFVGAIFLLAALSIPMTRAQDATASKRIGYVVYGAHDQRGHLEKAFLDGMRDQGYVEGRNLVIERVYAESDTGRLRKGAGALAALKLDAIVTTCTPSTKATKEATSAAGTPVLMAVVSDPVGQGLVSSLSHPGGHVSGRASQGEEVLPKMLEMLTAVVPGPGRVAVLYNTLNPVHPHLWTKLRDLGAARGVELARIDIAASSELPAAFERMARERVRGVLVLSDDPLTFTRRADVAELARKLRVPAIYGASEFVENGGLMSYGENYADSYRSTAAYVGKVLAGARPGDLPIERPTRFELVVNNKTARELGLAIPQSVLLRADRVIE